MRVDAGEGEALSKVAARVLPDLGIEDPVVSVVVANGNPKRVSVGLESFFSFNKLDSFLTLE
jgi:hypothetical protein